MEKKIIFIILSCILLCCTGCKTSADFNYIENSIRDQLYPSKLDKDIRFRIGSLSMSMINFFVDDEEAAEDYLDEIKSVQVGVYKIRNREKCNSFCIPDNVEKSMVEKGWEPFVHVRSRKGENVSLYYRQLSKNTASIYAIVLGPDELVITEIKGKLDNILDKAICERRLASVDRI